MSFVTDMVPLVLVGVAYFGSVAVGVWAIRTNQGKK